MILDLDTLPLITGFILPYLGETAPAGWLLCTGETIAASLYPRLCAILPAVGRTIPGFHYLPSLQSKITIAAGTGAGLSARTLYQTGGNETESLSPGQLPPHLHELACNGNDNNTGRDSSPAGKFFGTSSINRSSGLPITTPYATIPTENTTLEPTALSSSGITARHNSMMPFLVLNYIIKT